MTKKILSLLVALTVLASFGVFALADDYVPDSASYIGVEAAKEIALKDAGLSTATFTKAKLDRDDGVVLYELDFFTDTAEYDYDIHATNGTILDKEIESHHRGNSGQNTQTTTPTSYIGIDAAKELALKAAGLSTATFTKAKLGREDGVMVYEIEFRTETTKYEYDIDAANGTVLKQETKTITTGTKTTQTTQTSKPQNTVIAEDASYVGLDAAKSIALKAVGISEAVFTKAALDREDGVIIYDLKFNTSTLTYEAEIEAATGTVLEYQIKYSAKRNAALAAGTVPVATEAATEVIDQL